MAYVTIPKDLSKVQSKVLFGLTKRQVICFGAAAIIGVPLFFLTKGALGTTTAALCMILVMLPFFLFAMYEKNGQPLEVFLGHLIENKFIRPKTRIYQTNNLYSALVRQYELEQEVRAIAGKNGKTRKTGRGKAQADPRRAKADRGGGPPGQGGRESPYGAGQHPLPQYVPGRPVPAGGRDLLQDHRL